MCLGGGGVARALSCTCPLLSKTQILWKYRSVVSQTHNLILVNMKLLQQEWMKNVLLPLSSRKMKTVGKFTASLTAKKQREREFAHA